MQVMPFKRGVLLWLIHVFVAMTVLLALGRSWGPVPPIGPLLSPVSGLWQNIPRKRPTELALQGLRAPVKIYWDIHNVPHIFAQNIKDAYFTQGYLLALDRLFQMDVVTRIGLGTLSELNSKSILIEKDILTTRLGFKEVARRKIKEVMKNPISSQAFVAYTSGVNAYIDQIKRAGDLPVEYKFIGAFPEKWKPIRLIGIMQYMGWILTRGGYDRELTKLAQKYGFEKVEKLFPTFRYNSLPIARNFRFSKKLAPSLQDKFLSGLGTGEPVDPFSKKYRASGSNNWAIHPSHTKNRKTLVANDPHLLYILPSIWYELQIHTPDFNVYGAALPGAPGVVLGMTEKVAWAVTNVGSDVSDWYEVEFKDENSLEYKHDGVWKKARKIQEKIFIRGRKEPMWMDLIWTHHGVVFDRKGPLALVFKTALHEASNEFSAFLNLNRAKNFEECKEARVHLDSPAMNIICADANNIGIWHNGLLPRKWSEQGRYILNGRRLDHDWGEWLDKDELPSEINPLRGYVLSANQLGVGPQGHLYLGWDYKDSYRALAIDRHLKASRQHTPQGMMNIQNDASDLFTQDVKLSMVENMDPNRLKPQQLQALESLRKWEGDYRVDLAEPSLFMVWYRHLRDMIWEDQLSIGGAFMKPPKSSTVQTVVKAAQGDPWSLKWVDDIHSPEVEDFKDLLHESFFKAWSDLEKKLGPDSKGWLWEKMQETKLPHLLRIPGFAEVVTMGGTGSSILANNGVHGPSWKMVVEIGEDDIRGWINYPGGHSGNPFDPDYSAFVESWARGEMREMIFYKSPPPPLFFQSQVEGSSSDSTSLPSLTILKPLGAK